MSSSSDDAVLLDKPAPGVRLITLNRPQVRNAMTTEVTAAWAAAMTELAGDPDVRVLVVTGAGSSFCSGADLSWLDQGSSQDNTPDKMRDRMLPFYRTWLSPRELPFPVIAAVNGPAIGAGLCAALACDLRYAAATARFSAPFIYLGTHGGMAATWLLPEAIGVPRARDLLYTGRELSAEEALEWGLVSAVVDDVLDHSIKMAQHIATAAPIATRLTKAGLEQSANGLAASLQWEALAQPVTLATSDVHEGIQAKRERRPPTFTGR
ncbi:enoyl-CoA hydratase/isomerase family protein [Microtetraspora sp. AC03309]|uniref:enoyl-CoA hydratase/isomerase family protein n=1 Tax=Microtetraspora sp. AC03309 TaxID=2779376 RepID=UPI001E2F0A67|nr:enoyl-CoA hydratase/isomerase family protein [Microtetraspora sp. AC03309]MCC5575216.1 enoyl-CoA hydratase/isomerase family protein [Microtetraspora sp. AC03309]